MWRINEPSLTVASRGLAGLEITLTAASKDLHSGRHGGAVANPLNAMARLIATLHDADGRVAVAGFYDSRARAQRGRARGDRRAAVRRRGVSRAGRRAGDIRRGRVHDARATMDAPDARRQRHVGRLPGAGAEDGDSDAKRTRRSRVVSSPIRIPTRSCDWSRVISSRTCLRGRDCPSRPPIMARDPIEFAPDHFALARRGRGARGRVWCETVRRQHGWDVPISELFKRHMGLDTVFFSFSTADEDYHAPNEFFRDSPVARGARGVGARVGTSSVGASLRPEPWRSS